MPIGKHCFGGVLDTAIVSVMLTEGDRRDKGVGAPVKVWPRLEMSTDAETACLDPEGNRREAHFDTAAMG